VVIAAAIMSLGELPPSLYQPLSASACWSDNGGRELIVSELCVIDRHAAPMKIEDRAGRPNAEFGGHIGSHMAGLCGAAMDCGLQYKMGEKVSLSDSGLALIASPSGALNIGENLYEC
jgi:hypothetical protein